MDKSPVVLLAGPSGTGKSRLAAEKLHGYMLKYSGAMGLAVRKTRQSMVNSTILFLEHTIMGHTPYIVHKQDKHRFEYRNGSILAYGGMADEEQREQIRSIGAAGNVDFIWVEEAIRLVEDDYNELTARMRGTVAPWRQIILSTNPGPPSHWINQRLILGGEASVYDKATPEDNIYNPPDYIDTLKRMTGIMRQRLYQGLWVQAEGLVYPEFDLANLTDDEPDLTRSIEIGFDDGYVDPRAILLIQRTGNDVLVFDELYHSRHLGEMCVRETQDKLCRHAEKPEPVSWDSMSLGERAQWMRGNDVPVPEIAIGSPEAKELQGHFRQADIPCRFRPHQVVEGIAVVRELIVDGNGYRTLKVNRRCKNLIRELTEGYIYPEGGRRDNEKPLDGNDHAADALRYWCYVRAR